MKKLIKNTFQILPGLLSAFLIALLAKQIESILPIHIIGSSIIAMFIGIIINLFYSPAYLKKGLKFTSKKVLKFAIILLGASLTMGTVLSVGKMSLIVMAFTLLTCFGGGYLVGKLLKLDWKLSNLISAGTGICGGSAIAALAPVIDAEESDIAYALSATFLFDIVMIVVFPIIGHYINLNDIAYGLWAGTAVNDTSSVVAAGFAYSENAGDFATMVKLTRTLAIIPVILFFSIMNTRINRKELETCGDEKQLDSGKKKINIFKLFPWFIVGFIAFALANSFGILSSDFSLIAKNTSKFLMTVALAAIGLNTQFKDIYKSGLAPMLHGFIISSAVVVVAIAVEYFMGLV